MQQGQGSSLVALGAAVSKLLGRAIGACLASGAAPQQHTVVLELLQSPERPGLLALRVSDDGLPLPAEDAPLERCCASTLAGLAPLLAGPPFLNGTLLVQTTGVEELVVRRYSLQAAGGGTVTVAAAGAEGKPPGSGLCGSVFDATIQLQPPHEAAAAGWGSDGQLYLPEPLSSAAAVPPACLPASAEEVAGSLQQLAGMLRVLAPPVCLLMRLNGVLLQAPDGSLQRVSGSRRMDLPLDPALTALGRLREGMAAEFLPPPAAAAAEAAPAAAGGGGPASVLDDSALASASEQSLPSQEPAASGSGAREGFTPSDGAATAGGQLEDAPAAQQAASAAAAAAGPAGAPGPPPLLTYIGVGEAGWGCPGAAQQFRGCKWTARAGLVLQLPDHVRVQAALAAQRAAAAAAAAGPGQQEQEAPDGAAENGNSCSRGGAGDRAGPAQLPVYLFRSWALQLEGQAAAAKGLEKVDWTNYGFQLAGQAAGQASGADGALHVALQCAQPLSGAQLVAGVVHLAPNEHRTAAEGGKAPGLTAGYEARLVRGTLEGALQQLKGQCPVVVSNRRERSLGRALPLLSAALAGILLQSEQGGSSEEEASALEQACALVGCPPEVMAASLEQLLRDAVSEEAGAPSEAGSKRQRAGAGGTHGGEAAQP